jgi:hopene-associated glycosyltransferase HpnB
MTWLTALALAIWIYLLAGHGGFWQSGPILRPPAPLSPLREMPPVAIVVPARNEADSIVACLRSLLAQDYTGAFRVILVDDLSSDGTGRLADSIADPRLTVIRGAAHPPGWSGKLWALHQAIQQAGRTELLLLTDADIEHAPAHLTTLVTKLLADRLDMASEMVALHCASAVEHALVPPFVFFFQLLYPFAWVNDPGNPLAAAAGGTILIRAEVLARVGGLEAMRGALIDDVTLARRVKKDGRIYLGNSRLATSIRPYKTAGDVWRMVARCAYVQLGYSPWKLAGTLAGMALVWMVPPLATLFAHGAAFWLGLLGWAAMTASYMPTLKRFGLNPFWAICLPCAALFYTAATVGSALDHYRGRGVIWKQRAYHG